MCNGLCSVFGDFAIEVCQVWSGEAYCLGCSVFYVNEFVPVDGS